VATIPDEARARSFPLIIGTQTTYCQRTQAGLDAARARGRLGGRPTVLTPAKARQARKMRDEGATMDEIASVVGVSMATLYRRLDIQVGQRPSR